MDWILFNSRLSTLGDEPGAGLTQTVCRAALWTAATSWYCSCSRTWGGHWAVELLFLLLCFWFPGNEALLWWLQHWWDSGWRCDAQMIFWLLELSSEESRSRAGFMMWSCVPPESSIITSYPLIYCLISNNISQIQQQVAPKRLLMWQLTCRWSVK